MMVIKRAAAFIFLVSAILGASQTAAQKAHGFNKGARNERGSNLTQILGRPTDRSVAINVLAPRDIECFIEYGESLGQYTAKTAATRLQNTSQEVADFAIYRLIVCGPWLLLLLLIGYPLWRGYQRFKPQLPWRRSR